MDDDNDDDELVQWEVRNRCDKEKLMEDLYKGVGPDRMFLSYAVDVNSYNKVTMVDDLAALALKRLRQLGRLSKDQRKADVDTLTRFAESLAQISSFFASLPQEMRKRLSSLVTLETFFINEEICAQRDACDRFYFVLSGTVQCIVQENPYAPLTSRFNLSQGVNNSNTGANAGSGGPSPAAAAAAAPLPPAASAAGATSASAVAANTNASSGSTMMGQLAPENGDCSSSSSNGGGDALVHDTCAGPSSSHGAAAIAGDAGGPDSSTTNTNGSANASNGYGVTIEEGGARQAMQVAVLQAGDCFGAVSLESEMAGRKSACASLFARSKCEIFTLSAPYYKVTLHKGTSTSYCINSRSKQYSIFVRRTYMCEWLRAAAYIHHALLMRACIAWSLKRAACSPKHATDNRTTSGDCAVLCAEIKSRVVERLAFLRRLKLLRNVPIEELAAFSHVVGTAILANRCVRL